MNKKTLTTVIVFCSFFSASSLAENRTLKIEEAIESSELEIRISKDLTGIIKGHRCDHCELVLVKITPNTKLKINGIPTALTSARKCAGNPSTVIYKIETREVRTISCDR